MFLTSKFFKLSYIKLFSIGAYRTLKLKLGDHLYFYFIVKIFCGGASQSCYQLKSLFFN